VAIPIELQGSVIMIVTPWCPIHGRASLGKVEIKLEKDKNLGKSSQWISEASNEVEEKVN